MTQLAKIDKEVSEQPLQPNALKLLAVLLRHKIIGNLPPHELAAHSLVQLPLEEVYGYLMDKDFGVALHNAKVELVKRKFDLDAFDTMLAIINNPKSWDRDRIQAFKEVGSMLGYTKPQQIQVGVQVNVYGQKIKEIGEDKVIDVTARSFPGITVDAEG